MAAHVTGFPEIYLGTNTYLDAAGLGTASRPQFRHVELAVGHRRALCERKHRLRLETQRKMLCMLHVQEKGTTLQTGRLQG